MNVVDIDFGTVKTKVVELRGGVNENVSSLFLEGGELIECENYEIIEGQYGGYKSIRGFEQFDGVTLPSAVISYVITLEPWATGAIEVDDILVSEDAESFTVIAVHESIDTIEATTTLAAPTLSRDDALGTYTVINVRRIVGGTVDFHAAIDASYANVTEVPGEGPLLGAFVFQGVAYAFRKDAGANTIGCYKQHSITGWAEVTQATRLVYYGPTVHRFKTSEYTFYATSASRKIYICDGKNRARECNGTTLVMITMGDPAVGTDTPTSILGVNDRLYLAYAGGILVGSTIGDPLDYTTAPVLLTMGSDITNLTTGVGSTVVVGLKQGIKIIHGYTEDSLESVAHSFSSGSVEGTAQDLLGTIFFLSDQGVTTLEAVSEFGDYAANSVSQKIKGTLNSNRTDLSCTTTNREANQYRLFFSDGKAIFMSFEGKELKGSTLIHYKFPFLTVATGEAADGSSITVFTSDTGYLYKLDSGNSFNGEIILNRLRTSFYHYGSPRNYKRFKRATFEIFAENTQVFNVFTSFNYGDPSEPRSGAIAGAVERIVGLALWGSSKWAEMVWGGSSTVTSRVPYHINGVGENLSYLLLSREKYRAPHVIQNIITDYQLCRRST